MLVPGLRPARLVEPALLIYVLMFSVSLIQMDRIYLDKVCQVNLRSWLEGRNLTRAVCSNLSEHKEEQQRVQAVTAELKTVEAVLLSAPALLFSLFAGSYSDRAGRRPLLMLPFLCSGLSYLAMLVNWVWWDELPAQFLLLSGVAGLGGGYPLFNLGVYSYLADSVPADSRTSRMSLLGGLFSLGFVCGIQASAAISSFPTAFLLSLGLACLGLAHVWLVLEEARPPSPTRTPLFSLSHLRESAATAAGTGARGSVLIASFLALMLPLNTSDCDYLLTRLRFGWEARQWGLFLTVQRAARTLSLVLLLPLLSSGLSLADRSILPAGLAVTTASYLLLALAARPWQLYLAAATQLSSLASTTARAELSKTVQVGAAGKIFAVVGLGQAVTALLAGPLFMAVYRATLALALPSAYLLIVVACLAAATLASLASLLCRNNQNQQQSSGVLSAKQEQSNTCEVPIKKDQN